MKKIILLCLSIILICSFNVFAAGKITIPYNYNGHANPFIAMGANGIEAFSIAVSCLGNSSDGTGGTIAFPKKFISPSFQLVEVETVYASGMSTPAVAVTNENTTILWSLAAFNATTAKIYGGHVTTGIFPRMTSAWTFTIGSPGISKQAYVIFSFSRF